MVESRYEFARRQAMSAATSVAQLDFLETLDMLLVAGMASNDVDVMVTEGRAVEMLQRFKHYCRALSKIYQVGQVVKSLVLN